MARLKHAMSKSSQTSTDLNRNLWFENKYCYLWEVESVFSFRKTESTSNWKGNGMEVEKKQNAHIKKYLGIINPFWKIRAVEILSGHDIVCNVQFLFNVN